MHSFVTPSAPKIIHSIARRPIILTAAKTDVAVDRHCARRLFISRLGGEPALLLSLRCEGLEGFEWKQLRDL
jgi:hypothetical protein